MSDDRWVLRVKFSEEQHPRVPAGSPEGGQWTETTGASEHISYMDLTEEERQAYSSLLALRQAREDALASALNSVNSRINDMSPKYYDRLAAQAKIDAEKYEKMGLKRPAKQARGHEKSFARMAESLRTQWQMRDHPEMPRVREAMREMVKVRNELQRQRDEGKHFPTYAEARALVRKGQKEWRTFFEDANQNEGVGK